MGSAYIFTVQPTFTQGLLLGQLSILFLLVVILKYLFLDTRSGGSYTPSYQPRVNYPHEGNDAGDKQPKLKPGLTFDPSHTEKFGNADWLNLMLQQVLNTYRAKLRDNLPGLEGDEIARKRVEYFANKIRPQAFVDSIQVHSVDLGSHAPALSNARLKECSSSTEQIELDVTYTDSLSVSFSTAILFNYPFASFARLPVSLTITLSLFSSIIVLEPPSCQAEHPTITITLPPSQPNFVLDLKTTSLMGSRAKLADVPKLHELITNQVRKLILTKGTWKVVLPGLSSVREVQHDLQKQQQS